MFKFNSDKKTPIHISILLGICVLFGLLNFAMGWLMENPTAFEGVSKSTQGGLMLLANNGSRNLGIALICLLAIISRNPYYVFAALVARVVGEFLDIPLYTIMMKGQISSAIIAGAMFVWEIVAIVHIFKKHKTT